MNRLKTNMLNLAVAMAAAVMPIRVVGTEGANESPKQHSDSMDSIRAKKHGFVHIPIQGLDPDGKYEIRTYTGTLSSPWRDRPSEILWGSQRPVADLLSAYRNAAGDPTLSPEIVPFPIPDAIWVAGLHRNWRTGSELNFAGLNVDTEFPGDVLWVTYHKTASVADADPRTISLNGCWRIVTDEADKGQDSRWNLPSQFPFTASRTIQVPGNVNEVFAGYSGIVWYERTFARLVPISSEEEPILRFKGCSYKCEIWLNGTPLGRHEGGESPFELVFSRQLLREQNTLIVRVFFPKSSFMNGGSDGPCDYPVFWAMGGLIQGVDLLVKPLVRVSDVFVHSDWMTGSVGLETTVINDTGDAASVNLTADFGEWKSRAPLGSVSVAVMAPPGKSVQVLKAVLKPYKLWSLDDPFLYSVATHLAWKDEADTYDVPHFGFRDFRINAHGYFELNGKRLFLKCTHSINIDPLCLEGTPRDMTWLGLDFELLKATGFNTYRSAVYGLFPEQLDIADELGFLLYSEHQASWLMKDPSKFLVDLPELVRRDRNHPSLVIWGLLNEVGTDWAPADAKSIYETARDSLPSLRAIDDSRVMLLSSGRFDQDFKTGSASNPGSLKWNICLGGEDPIKPVLTNAPYYVGPSQAGAGDAHIYELYPITWDFIEDMSKIATGVRPIFVSEGGQGSSIDPFAFARSRVKSGGTSLMADVVEPRAGDLEAIWGKYGLYDIYPNIEEMAVDSQRMAATERASFLSILRSNPGINGYSMTDLVDTPDAEGIADEFRHLKAGHFKMLTEGWAKVRWCLIVNPTNIYSGSSLKVRASLANEDVLPPGDYPSRISIFAPDGKEVWKQDVNVAVLGGDNPPLSYTVFDGDVQIGGLKEGTYNLSATMLGQPNPAASTVAFYVTDIRDGPDMKGAQVTMLGVEPAVRSLLDGFGIVPREYPEGGTGNRSLILVGGQFKGQESEWTALYDRIAKGSFAIFLSREVLADKNGANIRIPLKERGSQVAQVEADLWPSQVIAVHHTVFRGLPVGLLLPGTYGELLRPRARFSKIKVPDNVVAVWMNLNSSPGFHATDKVDDGVVIGVYNYQKGQFLVNSLDLTGNVGRPAADRIILNMIGYGLAATADGRSSPVQR